MHAARCAIRSASAHEPNFVDRCAAAGQPLVSHCEQHLGMRYADQLDFSAEIWRAGHRASSRWLPLFLWWAHQFGRHSSVSLAAVSNCHPQPTSPRCRSVRVRHILTPPHDGGAPAPQAASCWPGVESEVEVVLVCRGRLQTYPCMPAERLPAG